MESLVLRLPVAYPRGIVGMPGQPGFDIEALIVVQQAIDIGVQLFLVDLFHLTTLSLIAGSVTLSDNNWRRRSRPRDSRDMTVPRGTPRMRAASA